MHYDLHHSVMVTDIKKYHSSMVTDIFNPTGSLYIFAYITKYKNL